MIEFSEEKINNKYEQASPAIKGILLDTWITEDVSLIGKKLNIRIDKIDSIIRIVGYVILNLIPLSRLISVIERETSLDKEKSTELAQKIDEIIFTKIRKKVRDYQKPSEESVEDNPDQEVSERMEDTEDLRKSLLKDIENHANEFAEESKNKEEEEDKIETFAEMLSKSKTTETSTKVVDPYRNDF